MLRLVVLATITVGVGLAGMVAGFLVAVEVNARTPNSVVTATAMLITAFAVACAITGTAAAALRHKPARRWALAGGMLPVAFVVLFAGGTAVFDALQPTPSAAPPAVVGALGERSHRIASTSPSHSDDDLAPLRDRVEGVRIVALGEATHGTAEFFRMKHRIVMTLVEHLGFRHFAMETNEVVAGRLNAYIQGDASEGLRSLYWPWATLEYVEFLDWMRSYNRDRAEGDRIIFHGIDPQEGDRDSAMAANVAALAASPDSSGIIIWAANSHIRGTHNAMGQHLREAFGDEVYLLGLEFHEGLFTSRVKAVQTYAIGPFASDYYSDAMAQLPGPARFLDFEEASERQPIRAWLSEPRTSNHLFEMYAFTRFFPPAVKVRTPWPELFDGIVFINRSHPATTLTARRLIELDARTD